MERLRELASAERRSINNEILVLLESAVEQSPSGRRGYLRGVRPERQAALWADLCGRWQDERSWEEIAADIVGHRTDGRQVAL